jgi:2-haloacid dehalogenase
MVAAHVYDLRSARENGLRTAYVPRPLEFGPGKKADSPNSRFDVVAWDFVELAEKLDA